MAGKVKLEYTRSTTFNFTHVYQKNGVDSLEAIELLFTVKPEQYDSDATDSTAILKKTIACDPTSASTVVTINPEDIPDTVEPGTYYFDLMIKESDGPPAVIYPGASGTFVLKATPTNREA